jgi:L-ribulose-5-phosphate 4-epimerase
MNPEEGYIRFNLRWEERGPVITAPMLKSLNTWRDIMYSLEMIGANVEGIGFGNLSARSGSSHKFYISGTATGRHKRLSRKHFCLVTDFDIQKNHVSCTGPVRASAESMTHAAIYQADPKAGSVFHIHHKAMWESLLDKVPTTANKAEYGTPEMARALLSLLEYKTVRDQRIAVMSGHEDGIIIWGKDADEAGKYLLSYYNLIV